MNRVLVANRGEIALRIIRSCRDLGIESVAAYTQVDHGLPYLEFADDMVCIGHHDYLSERQMLAAALSRGCDGVHPGYGFFAEHAGFAARVESEGLIFVGPSSKHIALMADKAAARQFMADHGVPVMPGSSTAIDTLEEATSTAALLGYPVMLKASHGGGGRGIRLVHSAAGLHEAWAEVRQQAAALFDSEAVYLEKYLEQARHVELQVTGDGLGKVTCQGARDCSVQRRHQKLIEESPPPGLDAAVIDQVAERACAALATISYRSAGTLEFLVSGDDWYFIEMNTRIQVEHPVTEMLTGLDLVALQLQLAAGRYKAVPAAVTVVGHAIECRINAEDAGYRPSPGLISRFQLPGGPGIRVDTHLSAGCEVSHYYDSLVAKIIAWGVDRDQAIDRMRRALGELRVEGIAVNRKLHLQILDDPRFLAGTHDVTLLRDSQE